MLGSRILAARRRAGMMQVELAVAMGDRYDQTMISHVEHDRAGLVSDGLASAARALDVSADYLLGLTDDPTPASSLVPALASEVREADVVALRDARASAGWGAEVDAKLVIGHVAFSRRWMRRHGLQPEWCSVIEVVGDSMEPLLEDGCWILVDHGRNVLLSGRVFAVWTGDGLVVKRAVRSGESWHLESENAAFDSLSLSRESRVVGEVKWAVRPV